MVEGRGRIKRKEGRDKRDTEMEEVCFDPPATLYLWCNYERVVQPALLGGVHVEKAPLQAGPAGRNRFSDGRQLTARHRAVGRQVVDAPVVHARIDYPIGRPQVGPEVASPADHLQKSTKK